jgi:hypothetical protein
MRDRDSLILESLYKNILLNENRNELSSFEERVLNQTAYAIKKELNTNWKNNEPEIHLKNETIKKIGSQIDFNDSYKMAHEMFSTKKHIIVERPYQLLSKNLYEIYEGEERKKYLNVIYDAQDKKQRITKEEYDELRSPDETIKTYSYFQNGYFSRSYLNAIQRNGLSNIYDPEEWNDPEYIAENNDDVNVLTIMNNILYPVKGMEKLHDVYEKLFKTMIIKENPKNPSYPKVTLFVSNTESEMVANKLINYLGRDEFLNAHKDALNILAHMIVYQFKDDPNLEGDYSKLLYLGAFVF